VEATNSFPQSQAGLADNPYIVALSRLHPKKNLESLIEAFVSLEAGDGFSQWRLVIAGDGESDYVAQLKKVAQTGGNGERIIFTGWLNGVARDEVLRNAQLLALPSRQENFGLCAAEALVFGVPVVVSHQVNLATDVQAANAGWVTGLEPKEIASTLREAMQDAAERKRRGRAGREFVSARLSWAQIAGELAELYRSVVDQRVDIATPSQNFQLAGQ
jgi:glycosyltransferase involved in cell wall biosynthesis